MARDERPWWQRIPQILGYPLCVGGIFSTIFLGFFLSIVAATAAYGFVGFGAAGVVVGLFFTTLFLVIRASADGNTEWPDYGAIRNVREDIVIPGVKATVLGVLLYLPAYLCLMGGVVSMATSAASLHAHAEARAQEELGVGAGADASGALGSLSALGLPPSLAGGMPGLAPTPTPDPAKVAAAQAALAARTAKLESSMRSDAEKWAFLGLLAGIGGCALYPLALLMLAITGSLLTAINPVVWFQALRATFVEYLGLLGGVAGIGVVSGIVVAPIELAGHAIPFLPSLLSHFVEVYFGLCTAHLLGWFVWQNHRKLGYSPDVREEMTAERVRQIKEATLAEVARGTGIRAGAGAAAGAGGIPARGVVPGPAAGAVPAAAANADGGRAGDDEVAGLAARFSSACAARDLASALASAPLLLDAYFLASEPASAIGIYRQLAALDADVSVDPPHQAKVARALEESGDALAAATCWRSLALKHPQHAMAPRALFRCAECYGKAGHPDWEKRALEVLLQRYPMDEAAGPASARLKRLS